MTRCLMDDLKDMITNMERGWYCREGEAGKKLKEIIIKWAKE